MRVGGGSQMERGGQGGREGFRVTSQLVSKSCDGGGVAGSVKEIEMAT